MATETIGVLETVVGGPAHLVGWSDGGIVSQPDLVGRLILEFLASPEPPPTLMAVRRAG